MSTDVKRPRKPDPRRARTRGALVTAGQKFLAEGRTAVSIQDITDRAGVGFGSFYNHFDTKEALFEAAVTATLQSYAEIRDALVGEIDDPAEVFAASFRLTGRLQRRMPTQVRIILDRGTRILEHDEGLAPRAHRDIQAGIDAGRFDVEDADLGLMLVGSALLGLLQLLESRPDVDDAETSDRFTARLLRALGVSTAEAEELCRRPLPALPDTIE